MSEVLLPEDIGRVAMISKVADAVREAMDAGGHHRPGRCPLRADQDAAADHRHHPGRQVPRARRSGPSTPSSRWTCPTAARRWGSPWRSARSRCRPTPMSCTDRSLYSSVASCSSGVELDRAQVVVVGNTRGIGGRYRIGHSRDEGRAGRRRDLGRRSGSAGLDLPERPHCTDLNGRLVNVFLKCEVSSGRAGARPAQRHAGRLRRALAPADQGLPSAV